MSWLDVSESIATINRQVDRRWVALQQVLDISGMSESYLALLFDELEGRGFEFRHLTDRAGWEARHATLIQGQRKFTRRENFIQGRRFLVLTFLTEHWNETDVKSAFRAGFGGSEIGPTRKIDNGIAFQIPVDANPEQVGHFANALRAELSRLG